MSLSLSAAAASASNNNKPPIIITSSSTSSTALPVSASSLLPPASAAPASAPLATITEVTTSPTFNSNDMTSNGGVAMETADGLVKILIQADDKGRYGFNVKGGADQGMPIIVSRVAPGTPADLTIPRLNEGDQVLQINGIDISQYTHEQVVGYIRNSRETVVTSKAAGGGGTIIGGELLLVVKPAMYIGDTDDVANEYNTAGVSGSGGGGATVSLTSTAPGGAAYLPDQSQYDTITRRYKAATSSGGGGVGAGPASTPHNGGVSSTSGAISTAATDGSSSSTAAIPPSSHIKLTGDPLRDSILELQDGLTTGAIITRFERMYRKKAGLSMRIARLADNIPKNRYRDISPYDDTRVVLQTFPLSSSSSSSSGDYINASHVNMEIRGSGIVNRYIAAQGPLHNTTHDFWQMIWQQQSSLVVMLTTKVERGRVKCHQYWPNLYETAEWGEMQITCLREQETPSFAFRDFSLVNLRCNEERSVRQMQYISWPDHGCPDDPADFLDFVIRVRQNRVGMVEPTVIHCSAGIGRTGVLITMETGMCLIEANEPVLPMEIVRQMRDQRAMLIQTTSQFVFVCEAILRVYNDAIVRPLDDFLR